MDIGLRNRPQAAGEADAQHSGCADLRIAEPLDYPAFKVDVDRNKALELGITENQVASSLLTALGGNSLIQPTFWLDTHNGVNYYVIPRRLKSTWSIRSPLSAIFRSARRANQVLTAIRRSC